MLGREAELSSSTAGTVGKGTEVVFRFVSLSHLFTTLGKWQPSYPMGHMKTGIGQVWPRGWSCSTGWKRKRPGVCLCLCHSLALSCAGLSCHVWMLSSLSLTSSGCTLQFFLCMLVTEIHLSHPRLHLEVSSLVTGHSFHYLPHISHRWFLVAVLNKDCMQTSGSG